MNVPNESTNDVLWSRLLDDLNESAIQISIVVSGGGAGAIARCFRRAGASKTFVEANVPYARAAMLEYLGEPLAGSSASVETAEQLSRRAYSRCCQLTDESQAGCAGIALVAALPTSPPRKVLDRVHVAVTRNGNARTWSKQWTKDGLTRATAEDECEEMFRVALASLIEQPG